MSELTPQSTAPKPNSIGRKRMRFSLRLLLFVGCDLPGVRFLREIHPKATAP